MANEIGEEKIICVDDDFIGIPREADVNKLAGSCERPDRKKQFNPGDEDPFCSSR